jgi:hypothetical protein
MYPPLHPGMGEWFPGHGHVWLLGYFIWPLIEKWLVIHAKKQNFLN